MVENYDIQIKEDGSRVVVRSLLDIADAADKGAAAVDRLIEKIKLLNQIDVKRVREYADAWGAAGAAMRAAAKDAERLAKATASIKTPRAAASGGGGAAGGGGNFPLATVPTAGGGIAQMAQAATAGGAMILRQREIFMGMVEEVNKASIAMNTLQRRTFDVKDGFASLNATAIPAMSDLNRLLALTVAYLSASKIIEYADAWAMLAGRVAVTTRTEAEAVAITEKLYEISQRTRTPIQEMSSLYQNLNIASKNLGSSQKDTLRFTELVGEALAVQKVPAATARGALLQLGQALDSGKVRAQEFNSVNLGVPYIMKIVSENIKGVGGNIAALRQLMLAGKLTSKEFFDAFMAGSGTIEADFAKTRQTFAQTFVVLENGLSKYFGQLNEVLGVSDKFGKSTKYLVENLDVLGGIFLTVATTIGAMLAPAALGGLVRLVMLAGTALVALAGPVGIALGVLAGLTTAVLTLGNQLQLGTKNGAGFRDMLQVIAEDASKAFSSLWESAKEKLGPVGKMLENSLKNISFGDIYMLFAKFFDYIVGGAVAATTAIIAAFGELPTLVPNILKDMYNASITVLDRMGNKILDQVDALRLAAGKPAVVRVETEKFEVDPNYFQNYVNTIIGSAKAAWDKSSHQVQDASKAMFDRADEIARRRKQAEVDISTRPAPVAAVVDEKGYDKAEKALRSLVQSVAPAYAATLQMKHAEDVLNTAVEKGVIARDKSKNGFESANFYMGLVRQHYQDIADPMGKFIRDTNQQTEFLALETRERQVAIGVEREMQVLKKAGIQYSEQELAIRQKILELTIRENQEAAREAARREGSINESEAVKLRNLKEELATREKLQQVGAISKEEQFTQGIAKSDVGPLFDGTQDALNAKYAQYQNYYSQIDMLERSHTVTATAAAQARMNVANLEMQTKVQFAQQMFGGIATLMQSGNRKAFQVGKAAAIAPATIDGVLAVQKADASAPYPWNIGIAAAAGVMAAMNVSKIASAQPPGFMAGGYTGDVGTGSVAGVVHGREFVTNAAATARNRPMLEAMNAGASFGGGGMVVYNSISVTVQDGNVSSTSDGDSDLATILQEGVTAKVMEILVQEKRQGGILSN